MRQLKDTYWNRFLTENKKGKFVRDGILFENLVEELLCLEYSKNWIRTPKSHDGNKDFYLFTQDKQIWAECKNYENTIALDTIAPTLVMAHIFQVNTILFFSYSSINDAAKRKILAFAEQANKEITIYDEYLLDALIIKHKEALSKNLVPSDKDIISLNQNKAGCEISFCFVSEPFLGSAFEDKHYLPFMQVEKVYYNHIFEILIFCKSNTLNNNFEITVSGEDPLDKENNECFIVLDKERKLLSDCKLEQHLSPGGGCVFRIPMLVCKFQDKINLPVLNVEIHTNKQIFETKKSPSKQVKVIWQRQTALIGEQYSNILSRFETDVLQRDRLGCFTIYGSSGTGKTRILKEALESLVKYHYKIASFIGNENESAQTILKEIIYFIYEIPRKEIFTYLDSEISKISAKALSDSPEIRGYELARKISLKSNEAEVQQIIEEYFDVLYERISNTNIAIIIDNMQYFSASLHYFIQKYIDYSKHQTRPNQSVLLISFNTDYMNGAVHKFLSYIKELEKDRSEFFSAKICGFSNENQAITFLGELLNIKSENTPGYLELIVKRFSLVPYHLYQIIYYLIACNVISPARDNTGYVVDIAQVYQKIETLPNDINDVIKKRWEYLLQEESLDESKCKQIYSFISIVGSIDSYCIEDWGFDKNYIQILENYKFLRLNENGGFVFDHDIIEAFFFHYYSSNYFEIIDYIIENQFYDKLEMHPFLNHCYLVKQQHLDPDMLEKIVDYNCTHQPPYKMIKPFFTWLISLIELEKKDFSSWSNWLKTIEKACNFARNILGFECMLKNYEMINCTIEDVGIIKFLKEETFRNYINTYTDICHYLGQSDKAIVFLEEVLNSVKEENTDQINALKSMIYNRMMINYREHDDSFHALKRDECLKKSMEYARKIRDIHLRDEFTYMNLSDEGYIYYALKKDKDKLLNVWEQCKEYTPERLPKKRLNYYRKMVQLNLIYGNLDQAEFYIYELQDTMKKQLYTAEQVIFSMFAFTAQCMCLILKDPRKNYMEINQIISELMSLARLRGNKKIYNILNLKAIAAYYNNDIQEMQESFTEAYNLIIHMPATMHLEVQTELLIANIIYALHVCNKTEGIYNILPKLSPDELQTYQKEIDTSEYYAKGILTTTDHKFNLPLVV